MGRKRLCAGVPLECLTAVETGPDPHIRQSIHGHTTGGGHGQQSRTWRDAKLLWQEWPVYDHVGVQHQEVLLSGLHHLEPLRQDPWLVVDGVPAHSPGCGEGGPFPT